VCHTDEFTRSGAIRKAFSRSFWATRARHRVDVGPSVTSVKKGDHVIPLYHARMPAVQVLPVAQDQSVHGDPRDAGQGVMPTGRAGSRSVERRCIITWVLDILQLHVLPRSVAKIREDAPFEKVCYIGCVFTTGSERSSTRPSRARANVVFLASEASAST